MADIIIDDISGNLERKLITLIGHVVRETTDDIRTDVAGMKSDVGQLKVDVGELKSDVGVLKSDVGDLKANVGNLKVDVGNLQSDVGGLKVDVTDFRSDITVIKNMLGNHGMRLQAIESELRSTKQVLRSNGRETSRLGQLIEDLEDRFSGAGELHAA